jgi:S-adenosylmethionine:tRNA ribosyltransferase-isomerase
MPGRRIRPGDRAIFGSGAFVGTFQESLGADLHVLEIESAGTLLDTHGEVPLPPYLQRDPTPADDVDYQTVFGSQPGAVAAPTAGLHFTTEILSAIRAKGVQIAMVTLHVGIGTFLPVRTEKPEDHVLRPGALRSSRLRTRRSCGRRYETNGASLRWERPRREPWSSSCRSTETFPQERELRIYIFCPASNFVLWNSLLTNFHLPRSTLLMLVSAFAGRELILEAYGYAVRAKYRFYSYGDLHADRQKLSESSELPNRSHRLTTLWPDE